MQPTETAEPPPTVEPMTRAPQKHQHTEAQVMTRPIPTLLEPMAQASTYLLGESSRSLGGARWDKFTQAFPFRQ